MQQLTLCPPILPSTRVPSQVLHEHNFPYSELKMLASAKSAGKTQEFEGKNYTIQELTAESFK